MKLLLAILLLAAPAFAGSYTITTTAPEDTKATRAMTRANKATCLHYGQSVGCTQAQARKEFCRRAGFGGVTTCVPNATPGQPPVCTTTPLVAACDGANQVNIFPDLASFLQSEVVAMVKDYGTKNAADDTATFRAMMVSGSAAQKDAACLAFGLAAGCLP